MTPLVSDSTPVERSNAVKQSNLNPCKIEFFYTIFGTVRPQLNVIKSDKDNFLEVNGLLGKGRRDQGMVRLG